MVKICFVYLKYNNKKIKVMKFITLTNPSGNPIYVNPDHIGHIYEGKEVMEYGSIKSLPNDQLLFSMEEDEMHAFNGGVCVITSEPEQGDFRLHTVSRNVHVMNKRAILRNKDEIIAYAIS